MAEDAVKDFQLWIRKSREAAKRNPERYIGAYDLEYDDTTVWMTQETYDAIVRNCGVYNGTMPTGQYCGKMFVRNGNLMWFGISKDDALHNIKFNTRAILIKNGSGPAFRPTY